MEGNEIWKYHDKTVLDCPTGIDVDLNCFVYVIGSHSYNLVVISPDWQQMQQLVTKEDGLVIPQAIYKTKNVIIIANYEKTIFKYKIMN